MAVAAALGGRDRPGKTGRHSAIHSHKTDSAFRAARAHSAKVRILRIALPVLGGLIAIGFVGYSWLMTAGNVPFKVSEIGIVDGKLIMASPNMTGYTKDNRPYRIMATRAVQDFGNLERVVLEDITASLPVQGGTVAQVRAASGIFDNAVNSLNIDSPLTIVTDDGMTAKLGDAKIDIAKGTLHTDRQVDIDIGGSQISAESLTVEDNGKVLVFDRNVRMTLIPDKLKRRADDKKPAQD